MDVVVLAGGGASPEMRAEVGVETRAELPVGGLPMLDRVLEAVRHLGDPIVVGGPERPGVRAVEAGPSFLASLEAGLDAVRTEQFLLVTADLPFLSREAVDDFLDRCDREAIFNYPVIRAEDALRRFPGMQRTTANIREGRFTGGNIALVHTRKIRQALPRMEEAYALRKKPLRLAGMVGWGTLVRLAIGQVLPGTLPAKVLVDAVSRSLGAPVHAVFSPFPELGADIDDLDQYRAITTLQPNPNPAD